MTKTRDDAVKIMLDGYFSDGRVHWVETKGMEAAYDALVEAGVVPQWRDIKDAPKGTVLLLWVPNDYSKAKGNIVMGSWKRDGNDYNKKGKKGWFSEDGDDFSTSYYFTPLEPTHWQPLPTPPHSPAGDK